MVGLHVVDEDIVQRPAVQGVLQVLHELGLNRPVHRVKEDGFFVQQQIGVVGHPPGDRVSRLKNGVLTVVGADPDEVVGNFTGTIHEENLSFVQKICH